MLLEEFKILSLRTWISWSEQFTYSLFLPKDPQRSGMILNSPYKQRFHVALWFYRKACPSGNQPLTCFSQTLLSLLQQPSKSSSTRQQCPPSSLTAAKRLDGRNDLSYVVIYEPHPTAEQRKDSPCWLLSVFETHI